MKFLFVLLAVISLISCSDDDSRKKRGERDRNPELAGDELNPEDEDSEDEDSESKDDKKPKETPINSFKIAQTISNFKNIKKDSSVCEFKVEHIAGNIFVSGANLVTSEGSYKKIPKIFINSPGMNWRDDFKYMSRNHFFKDDTLVLPYKYDPYEKYGNWCPKKEDCIVYVVLKGEIHEPRYPDNHYLYNGKLLILIVFNDQLLDFSVCSKS